MRWRWVSRRHQAPGFPCRRTPPGMTSLERTSPVDQSRNAGGKSMGSVIANKIFQTQFGVSGEIGDVIGDKRHPQCDGMRGNQLVERIPLELTGGQTHRAIGKRGGTIEGRHCEVFRNEDRAVRLRCCCSPEHTTPYSSSASVIDEITTCPA